MKVFELLGSGYRDPTVYSHIMSINSIIIYNM